MRSDTDIKRDVENELRWSPHIDVSDIAVAVKGGTVELAGFVKRYIDKYNAETAAKKVAGVAGLANDIEVRLPQLSQRPDPDIARDAVTALDYSRLGEATIKPIVKNGWVTLEGTAEWHYQQEDAESTVRRLRGVKGVTNLVQLKPRGPSPGDVKTRIEDALKRNAAIDAKQITVAVTGGSVTLNGSVRSWSERSEAEAAAWAAPGVTQVHDGVTVHY